MSSKIVIRIDKDLEDLIPNFIKNRENDLISLKEHLDKGEIKEIESIGHKVAGSSGGYGFIELGKIAKSIEMAAMDNDTEKIKTLISDYENHIHNVEVEFVEMDDE